MNMLNYVLCISLSIISIVFLVFIVCMYIYNLKKEEKVQSIDIDSAFELGSSSESDMSSLEIND